jgi:class 3 adenylate cyclase
VRAALLLWAVLVLLGAADARAEEPFVGPRRVVLREGAAWDPKWRARAGDDPSWASTELDDSDWRVERITWGTNLVEGLEGDLVWYRTSFAVEPPDADQEVALAVVTSGAAEIYADGRLVGRQGIVGSRLPILFVPNGAIVPRELASDGRIEVAVRVWMPRTALTQGGGAFKLSVADAPLLGVWLDRALLWRRTGGLWMVVESALAALAGAGHLVLYARRRDLRAHGWFGLGSLGLSVNVGLLVAFWHGWWAPFPGAQLALSLSLATFFGALTLFCGEFFRTPARLARVVAAIAFAGSAARPFLWIELGPAIWIVDMALVAVGVAHALWALGRGLRRGVPGSRTVGVGIAAFLVYPVAISLVSAGLLDQPHITTIRAAASLALTVAMILGLAGQFGASIEELERTYRAARWFVPVEFLERLGRTRIGEVRRGDVAKLEMSMLFFDIRGFSTLAEKHAPERTFALVNALFDHLEPHIRSNRGFVIQFTGDGFLALFPDADGAVQSALDQQAALARFDHELLDGKPLRAGMGIHTGPMTLGTIGGADQLLAGVVGDAANLASRIEGMTKMYGVSVLISESTRAALVHPERFTVRELDRVVAKGRNEPIGVCEVGGSAPEPFRPAYEHYRSGRFGEALAGFEACSGDGPAAVLAERCRRLLASPPGAWDGVWRLDTK